MNTQQKMLLAAAAMTGLLAGASVRAAATATPTNAAATAKPATVTTDPGVRGLTGPTSKPAGNGSGGGQNTCGSVL